ncbi:hypothetical protein [Dictyobacter aurantiacus]|uniref:DUF1616 domain-containing protein n=1 Tax=Dictyobacter aurantiacus TaxID=1936993 RepID=A0A401Z7G4_9CHLR|nr:hypothetical protein [Dictyobacter aurantiacus]GCE02779.1 hypothetical protein KDAU_01080 [Dictyobacter aurantiacus]
MRYARWFWPIIIICFALAAPITMRVLPSSPLRPLVMMVFLFICPGMALIRFLHLRERASKLALALAVSFSVDGLIAGVYLYSYHWSPLGIMSTLALISIVAVIVEVTNAHVALYQHISVLRRLGTLLTHPLIIGTSPVRHVPLDIVETPTVQIPSMQVHAQAKGRSYQNGDAPCIEETPTMLLPSSQVTNGGIEDRPTAREEIGHTPKIAAEVEDLPTAQLGAVAAPQSNAEIEDLPTTQLGAVTAEKTPPQIVENTAQVDQGAANKKRPPMQFVIHKKAREEEIEHKPARLEDEMVQKPAIETPRNESGKTDAPGHDIASTSQPLQMPGQRPRIGRSRLQSAPKESNPK